MAGAAAGVQYLRVCIERGGVDHQVKVLARGVNPALAIVGGDIAESLLHMIFHMA